MDYYFQEQIRWTLGFENPNKAGALVASCLPLLWIVWRLAGRVPARGWRILVMLLAGLVLSAGWWVLFKTYSRGGIVAAGVAFGYLGWGSFRRAGVRPSWKSWAPVFLLAGIVGTLFFSTTAAARSTQWLKQREGSVENRYTLWQGGLRMIHAVPQGVGSGNSGEFYMQWFQPLQDTTRYRTLVNSYLTFTAERGLWALGLAVFAALLVWQASLIPDERGGDGRRIMRTPSAALVTVSSGWRASLLAFAAAGLFSTTMEERTLWIVPAAALACLVGIAAFQRSWPASFRPLSTAAGGAVGLCAALWLAGWWLTRHDEVRISGAAKMIILTPAHPSAPPIQALLDREVLGRNYGKLLRRLCAHNSNLIFIPSGETPASMEGIVLASGVTARPELHGATQLILLAPAELGDAAARRLLTRNRPTLLLLPDVDEDGRAHFWKEATRELPSPGPVRQEILAGVGTHVEWAWDQILQSIRDFSRS